MQHPTDSIKICPEESIRFRKTLPNRKPNKENSKKKGSARGFEIAFHVFVSAANLALGKPTAQSSTREGSEDSSSHNAVDGCLKTNFYKQCCTHTKSNNAFPPSAWWGVDLAGTYAVVMVKVLNRGDCCGKNR